MTERTTIGLFDGSRHVGSVTLPEGRAMPEAVTRGDEVFLYFQGDQLIPGQRPGDMRLELKPGESARFLKVADVLHAARGSLHEISQATKGVSHGR